MWDVGGNEFENMKNVSVHEFVHLSLKELELDAIFFDENSEEDDDEVKELS